MLAKKEISPIVKPKVCEEEIKIERETYLEGKKNRIKKWHKHRHKKQTRKL